LGDGVKVKAGCGGGLKSDDMELEERGLGGDNNDERGCGGGLKSDDMALQG